MVWYKKGNYFIIFIGGSDPKVIKISFFKPSLIRPLVFAF